LHSGSSTFIIFDVKLYCFYSIFIRVHELPPDLLKVQVFVRTPVSSNITILLIELHDNYSDTGGSQAPTYQVIEYSDNIGMGVGIIRRKRCLGV
jgi:hypothetical protein